MTFLLYFFAGVGVFTCVWIAVGFATWCSACLPHPDPDDVRIGILASSIFGPLFTAMMWDEYKKTGTWPSRRNGEW